MNTKLYTGNGGTNAITGVGFQPAWTWLKNRSTTQDHEIYDAVRGATKAVHSNSNSDQSTYANGLNAFGTDGFTVGDRGNINGSGNNIVSWNWKAGTTSVPSGGSITPSAVSINTTSGFGIYKYAGVSGASATIAHGLGVAPELVIAKKTSASTNAEWTVYHGANTSAPATDYLSLSSSAGTADADNRWYDTKPTSSLITVGDSMTNEGGSHEFIMYAFAPKRGYSKFGSYVGNGDDDGNFLYTGMKPSFFMVKRTDSSGNWLMFDNKRDPFNEVYKDLRPNSSNAEDTNTGYNDCDFLSNGIKLTENGADFNNSGSTYIYMAFGQSLVGSNNVPCTAR
jgi:hypothetical protein